jgi:hypothetical protein
MNLNTQLIIIKQIKKKKIAVGIAPRAISGCVRTNQQHS